ncbi:MAG TPA: V-type ATP synthase subunit C [Clostridia bacterium]|nr:V-type ATP synthase subunit C [Clostridia bacterium]
MDRQDYIYASARIRVFEKNLLKKEQLHRLAQAGEEETFLHYLQETDYGKYLQNIKEPEAFHKAMDENWQYNLSEVLEMSKDPEVIEILSAKYVYHNYKVLVKEKILGQDLSPLYILVPGMDVEGIRNSLAREEETELANFIYQALEDYEENKDAQRIDLILDKAYYEDILAKAIKLGDPLFIDFVQYSLDFSNAKALVRLKAQGLEYEALEGVFLPGGHIDSESFKRLYKEEPGVILEGLGKLDPSSTLKKAKLVYEDTGSLASVERLMEDAIMNLVRDGRRITYGPEVLFGYLLAKEKEIMNLRMIFTSLVAGIAPERIEERLRDSYV